MIDFKGINEAASKMGESAAVMANTLEAIRQALNEQTELLQGIAEDTNAAVRVLGDIERGINSIDGKTPLR